MLVGLYALSIERATGHVFEYGLDNDRSLWRITAILKHPVPNKVMFHA
jgi:hypothetical protein